VQYPVPVMQCLHIKSLEGKAPGGLGTERYRIVLSDVSNYIQCMLATQANHVMHDGQLQRGAIVRVKQYQAQLHKGKKCVSPFTLEVVPAFTCLSSVMIVLDLEVIASLGTPDKIGEPKGMETTMTERQNTAIGGAGMSGAGFYGAKSEPAQEAKPQVQRQVGGHAGGFGGNNSGHPASTIYPVEAVSPFSNKWTIKVRVTMKSEIKRWNKATGEGKLFSVNLLDESGEIRATAFTEQVDQFYDLLQEGSVYYISTPCKVVMAKKQFSNLSHDYELTFERDTVVEKAEDQSSVPQVRFNFCNIEELQSVEKDATVDIVGVLTEVKEVDEIQSKTTKKPYSKRELMLADETGYQVRVTIWGKTATEFDAKPESIVAFKGTRVSDFGGRSLSLLSSGTMAIDPDIPEAHRLKGWYDSAGRSNTFTTHQNLSSVGSATGRKDEAKTIGQVKDENLGFEDTVYFTVKATVVHIKHDNTFAYPACLNAGCNRKVTNMGDGTWRCEKCEVNHPRPQYRYIMSVNVSDHTGHMWVTCFDDSGLLIMGKTADEVMELQARGDGSEAEAFVAGHCKKLVFRCRAKMETYNEQPRYVSHPFLPFPTQVC